MVSQIRPSVHLAGDLHIEISIGLDTIELVLDTTSQLISLDVT
jgi:hypothetical protein